MSYQLCMCNQGNQELVCVRWIMVFVVQFSYRCLVSQRTICNDYIYIWRIDLEIINAELLAHTVWEEKYLGAIDLNLWLSTIKITSLLFEVDQSVGYIRCDMPCMIIYSEHCYKYFIFTQERTRQTDFLLLKKNLHVLCTFMSSFQ